MKQIVEIAYRELRSMFYSPVGWLTLIVFAIHTSIIVSGRIDSIVSAYELRGIDESNFTSDIFSNLSGVFRTMEYYFYLYIPLLTMGLLSKEYNEGGIKLLFSSPIKTRDIVFGKFSALLVYALLLLSTYVILAILVRVFVTDTSDVSLFIAGFIQNYFMICLYISIGLFVSSLTSYQLVAAVGTFAILFILNNYLSTIVQESHHEIIQLLLGVWLSPNLHSDSISGLINTSDIIYYLVLTTLFLSLTFIRLQFLRESRSIWSKTAIYVVVTLTLVSIGLYTYTPERFHFLDFTDSKMYSFSEEQNQVFNLLESPLTFTKYTHVLENPSEGSILGFSGRVRNVHQLHRRLKLKPSIKYVPYYAQTSTLNLTFLSDDTRYSDANILAVQTPARLNRSTYDLDLIEIAKDASNKYAWFNFEELLGPDEINLIFDTTLVRYNSKYLIESGDKSTYLNIGLGFPNDQHLTTAVKSMFNGLIKIGFISGNGERSPFNEADSDFSRIFNTKFSQNSLINQGFENKLLSFSDRTQFDDIQILMIANPLMDYNEENVNQIIEYLESGRNMIITTSNTNGDNLKEILEHLGLYIEKRRVEHNFGRIFPPTVDTYDNPNGFLVNKVARHLSRNAELLNSEGNGSEISIKNAAPLLRLEKSLGFDYYPVIVSGIDTLIYALIRERNGSEQRIIVSGDSNFLSNGIEGIGFQSPYGTGKVNSVFALSLFHWLSNDEYPTLVERDLMLGRLKAYSFDLFKLAIVGLIPLPIILFGAVVLYRRKQK